MTDSTVVALMAELHGSQYQVAVHAAHGEPGLKALTRLFEAARELLKHVPCEMLTTGVDVVVTVDGDNTPLEDGGAAIHDLSELSGKARSELTVQVGTSAYRVWPTKGALDAAGSAHLRYEYVHADREDLHVDGTPWEVNDGPWPCMLATPTFTTVEQALAAYVAANRKPEQCAHLAASWRDDKRLAHKPKPEALMRRSMIWALSCALSHAAQVRPEQNQSETKPVDIEITWWGIKRSAIIEIKWLGDSAPVGDAEFKTSYTQSRAVDGLNQLADYLDLRDATTSDVPVMGYLFVFDARRRGLAATQTSITAADGLHYALSDPPYPQEVLDRPDMGRPFRCFMEPIFTA